ncbi:hypothetical protein ACVSMD_44285, partial [Pseudomonas aeruginosa]
DGVLGIVSLAHIFYLIWWINLLNTLGFYFSLMKNPAQGGALHLYHCPEIPFRRQRLTVLT